MARGEPVLVSCQRTTKQKTSFVRKAPIRPGSRNTPNTIKFNYMAPNSTKNVQMKKGFFGDESLRRLDKTDNRVKLRLIDNGALSESLGDKK